MQQAAVFVPWADVEKNPDVYRGKLFVLGGVIVSSRLIESGSLIEAAYVPVDSNGYLLDSNNPGGRFNAFYPKAKGILDPVMYSKGRMITIVAEFVELRQGKIEEMSYTFPHSPTCTLPGHWLPDLSWAEGSMWPEEAQIEDFILKITRRLV